MQGLFIPLIPSAIYLRDSPRLWVSAGQGAAGTVFCLIQDLFHWKLDWNISLILQGLLNSRRMVKQLPAWPSWMGTGMVEGASGRSGIQVEHGETCRQITGHSLASACVCQELNPCPQFCSPTGEQIKRLIKLLCTIRLFFSKTWELWSVFLTGQESLSCHHQGSHGEGVGWEWSACGQSWCYFLMSESPDTGLASNVLPKSCSLKASDFLFGRQVKPN